MEPAKTIKSSQEQAVAAWIGYLNDVRIAKLLQTLAQQDVSLDESMRQIDWALKEAHEIIETNNGGANGAHGFIAEIAETGITNARRLIVGESANMQWLGKIDPYGPIDMIRDGVDIQSKFYSSWYWSLHALTKHLDTYPDFLKQGGKYQIPQDQYEVLKQLLEMPQAEAAHLVRGTGGPSYTDWKYIQQFFEDGPISFESVEPSKLDYGAVQREAIDATMDAEKETLQETDAEIRVKAHEESKSTFQEGVKATVVAAAIEGGTTFVMQIAAKRKAGKSFRDLDGEDWVEILGETGKGFGKGGVRGASVYFLTNRIVVPSAVASAIVTSSFGIAEQAHLLRMGEVDEVGFIENSEMLCLDASVSALSSIIGQTLIPVPVLGAVIGNAVGTVMYQAAKDGLSKREREIIEAYAREQRQLDAELADEYQHYIDCVNASMVSYLDLLDRAFAPDPWMAFEGSIALAHEVGVPAEDILDTREKAMAFFMD